MWRQAAAASKATESEARPWGPRVARSFDG